MGTSKYQRFMKENKRPIDPTLTKESGFSTECDTVNNIDFAQPDFSAEESFKFTNENMKNIHYDVTDESSKIIMYLEEMQKRQRLYNILILAATIIGAIGSFAAAIIGILMFFQ